MPELTTPKTITERRAAYLRRVLAQFSALEPTMAPRDGRRWALSHARLVLNRDLEKANAYLCSSTLTENDRDIYFIRFLKTLLDFQDSPRLFPQAREHLTNLLTSWPVNELSTTATWPAIHTENHDLMQLTIGMFARQYQGRPVSDHLREIHQALTWRFERGWIEWNSACYQYHYSNPLIILAEHAPSENLRRCAQELLNILLAERALLSVNGFLGGPSFRCRTADAFHSLENRKVAYLEDARYDAFLPTVWLAFGLGEPSFDFTHARVKGLEPATTEYATANEPRLKQDEGMFFAASSVEPHPLVSALAAEAATRPVLIYQGQRYLGWPGEELGEKLWDTQRWMPGAIYYYNTPHISLGSVHSSGWICQSRYDQVLFAADPSQGLRVEIILPGVPPHKRRYEARGRVVQHQNWLLGQGTLFEDGGVKARRRGAWNLYQVGQGLCAHYALPDSYHVLQVSDLDQYPSAEAFLSALAEPTWEETQVRGLTTHSDRIVVDLADMSLSVNGTPRPHPPAKLHDCEYMESEYGSGKITLHTRQGSVTFAPTPL
ncbi:MAG: hypothetical protein GX100_00460 [candidate division WS1 bacterium]|jgi:hypothetical protein|nr:hypothetical protein [candidate division WS1 bacterium]